MHSLDPPTNSETMNPKLPAKFKSQKEDWSTWTFNWPPTYLTWTMVDIWLTSSCPRSLWTTPCMIFIPPHEIFTQALHQTSCSWSVFYIFLCFVNVTIITKPPGSVVVITIFEEKLNEIMYIVCNVMLTRACFSFPVGKFQM